MRLNAISFACVSFVLSLSCAAQFAAPSYLTATDQLAIITQLNLHQAYIDNDGSLANATRWLSLYWPDASFTNSDSFGTSTRTGALPTDNNGLKYFYDFDHSVFPLQDWFHSVGTWTFIDSGNPSTVKLHWRWRVDWKNQSIGVVSTGTYDDLFENRGGVWKCKERISNIDPNWPTWVFAPYAMQANYTFKSSS